MAKQTFTTGQVLTAAQMTSLQQTAMGGGSATAKTASYTLVAADAGTTVIMNSASSTTITVNTALFAAGDTVLIVNQGAGVCTITAGTATVSAAGSLVLSQYETGQLYFLSASAAIFTEYIQTVANAKVLQVVSATTSTTVSNSTTTYADTGLTVTITPTLATSKILVLVSQNGIAKTAGSALNAMRLRLNRDATAISTLAASALYTNTALVLVIGTISTSYLDSPNTTSATTYKTQFISENITAAVNVQTASETSTITVMEIGV